MLRILDLQRAIGSHDAINLPVDVDKLSRLLASLPNKKAHSTRWLSASELLQLLELINSRKPYNMAESAPYFEPLLTLLNHVTQGNLNRYLQMQRQGELTQVNCVSILNPLDADAQNKKQYILDQLKRLELLNDTNVAAVTELRPAQLDVVAEILVRMDRPGFTDHSCVRTHLFANLLNAPLKHRQKTFNIILKHKDDKNENVAWAMPMLADRMFEAARSNSNPKTLKKLLTEDKEVIESLLPGGEEAKTIFREVTLLARSSMAQSSENNTYLYQHVISPWTQAPLDPDLRKYLSSDNATIANAARAAVCLSLLSYSPTIATDQRLLHPENFLNLAAKNFANRLPSVTDWLLCCELIKLFDIRHINFKGCDASMITPDQWQRLLNTLKQSKVTKLSFGDTRLFRMPIECRQLFLEIVALPQLTEVYVAGNDASNHIDAFKAFLSTISRHPNISVVDVEGCVDNGLRGHPQTAAKAFLEHLIAILPVGRLNTIKMSRFFVQRPDAECWSLFCKLLQSPNLRSLDLHHCIPMLRYEGSSDRIPQFLAALEQSSLETLILGDNMPNPTTEDVNDILSKVRNNFSLTTLTIFWHQEPTLQSLLHQLRIILDRNKTLRALISDTEIALKAGLPFDMNKRHELSLWVNNLKQHPDTISGKAMLQKLEACHYKVLLACESQQSTTNSGLVNTGLFSRSEAPVKSANTGNLEYKCSP